MTHAVDPVARTDAHEALPAGGPPPPRLEPGERRSPDDLVVPLVDVARAARVYHPSMLWWSLAGAGAAGVLLGWLGYAVGTGLLPIAGGGQFAASGAGVAAFTGAGIGVALGGAIGGLAAVLRVPRTHEEHGGGEHDR